MFTIPGNFLAETAGTALLKTKDLMAAYGGHAPHPSRLTV